LKYLNIAIANYLAQKEVDTMKTQEAGIKRVLIVKLERGDKVVESLKKACDRHKIESGIITGIGAVSKARVIEGKSTEHLDPNPQDFDGPMEISNATGNVAKKDGDVYIHLHVSLGRKDFSTLNGHLVEGEIYLVGEFFIFEIDGKLERALDETIKMFVWDMNQ